MRNDLQGLAQWDAHREAWVPEYGKRDEVAAKLGPTWVYDEYYGSFFGADPPKPAPAPVYNECGCYMCQGGSSCGGHMCCVEVDTLKRPGRDTILLTEWGNGSSESDAEALKRQREMARRVVSIFAGLLLGRPPAGKS